MVKPENPYKKGTLLWSIMEGDWEDLTAIQIGEVMDVTREKVYSCLSKIKKDTGYIVPHVSLRKIYSNPVSNVSAPLQL